MARTLTVSFIIHDDFSHIHGALESLYAGTETDFEIYITINTAPHVAELQTLQSAFPDVHLHINEKPAGFATNHNRIMQMTESPFLALLNDDIRLQPGVLDEIIQFMKSHCDVGLVAPLIQNPDGTPQLSVFSDPTLFRAVYKISGLGNLTPHGGIVRRFLLRTGIAGWFRTESLKDDLTMRDVPVVVGVCMIVRREVYQLVGGMDEDTRVYGEEYGWHRRIRQAGWRIVFMPQVAVTHYNVRRLPTGWKLAEHRKSILAYFLRYKPRWQSVIVRVSIIIFHLLWAFLNLPISRGQARQHWLAVRVGLHWRLPP